MLKNNEPSKEDESETEEAKSEPTDEHLGKGSKGGFKEALLVPAKINAEDVLKAVRVINDKGGSATVKDVVEIFGGAKKREFLSRALGFDEKLGLLAKDGLSYAITDDGRGLLTANEEDKKAMLARKLVRFKPYRDVFLRLRDEGQDGLKKETITEMWSNLAGGGGKKIRQGATMTFASLAEYSGLADDSGKTLTLRASAVQFLQDGQQLGAPTTTTPPPPGGPVTLQGFEDVTCPRCNGKEFGVLNEEVVEYFKADGQTVVFLKFTFHCRTCKEPFSRHGQRFVAGLQKT